MWAGSRSSGGAFTGLKAFGEGPHHSSEAGVVWVLPYGHRICRSMPQGKGVSWLSHVGTDRKHFSHYGHVTQEYSFCVTV